MLIAMLLATAEPPAPVLQEGLRSIADCGRSYAEQASFDRQYLDSIVPEAEAECISKNQQPMNDALATIGKSSPAETEDALKLLKSRLRQAAYDALINRLEKGDVSPLPDVPNADVQKLMRAYLDCVDLTLWRRVQTASAGENLPFDLREMKGSTAVAYLTDIGRKACPATRARARDAWTNRILKDAKQQERREIERDAEGDIAKLEAMAVDRFAAVILDGLPKK